MIETETKKQTHRLMPQSGGNLGMIPPGKLTAGWFDEEEPEPRFPTEHVS